MKKQVYISADYSVDDGDRAVVDVLKGWAEDKLHKVDFIDMAEVKSGTVANDPDCRICDLKAEFNSQINASSAVIIVVGDMTAYRTAGSSCQRGNKSQWECNCTPYKQNTNGKKDCKISYRCFYENDNDVSPFNSYSYLRHEFEQAQKRGKKIIVVYNSLRKESSWLPSYLKDYEDEAEPFWVEGLWDKKGNYEFIKEALGYV